jgi:hypothetical protein
MTIGIDGNMWYVSNGLCLGDPRSRFSFARTIRSALHDYNLKHVRGGETVMQAPPWARPVLDLTPEEYKARPSSDSVSTTNQRGSTHD